MKEKKIGRLITNLQLFADEKDPAEKTAEAEQQAEGNEQYIKAIAELKENSVSKDKYQKVLDENKALLKSLVDGSELPPGVAGKLAEAEADPESRIKSLREELFGPNRKDMNNLETVQKTLELRKLIIEETGVDPAVSSIKNPEESDYEMAEKTAELLESCIEAAEGNSEVFTAVLQSKLQDDRNIIASRAARKR